MVKAILFDFDDTLGNREVAAYDLYTDILKPHFSDALKLESAIQDALVFEQYGNCHKGYVQEKLEKRYGISLGFDLHEDWDKYIGKYAVAFDDTVKTLEYLKGRYLLGVVTNGLSYTQNEKIETAGIKEYFDMILPSQDVGVNKPDPRIFRTAAERLGLDVSECVYVGDTFSNDVYGALSAGMDAIWLWKRGQRLCSCDIRRIGTLSELTDIF